MLKQSRRLVHVRLPCPDGASPAVVASLCVAGVCCKCVNPRIRIGEPKIDCMESTGTTHPCCGEKNEDSIGEFVCLICMKEAADRQVTDANPVVI